MQQPFHQLRLPGPLALVESRASLADILKFWEMVEMMLFDKGQAVITSKSR